jgi:hypothetical protein
MVRARDAYDFFSAAPGNHRFLGPIGLKDLVKEHLLIQRILVQQDGFQE